MEETQNTPLWLRLLRRVGNPLDWNTVNRCLFVISITLLIRITVFLFELVRFQVLPPYINPVIFKAGIFVACADGLIWIFLLLIALRFRRQKQQSSLLPHVIVQLSVIEIAALCYMVGPVTHPIFILALAWLVFIILLFEATVAVLGIGAFTIFIIGSMMAVWFDIIPYAPVFTTSPFVDGKIAKDYLRPTFTIVLIITLLTLFLFMYLVVQWRDREARLADMTTLLKKMFGRYLSTEVMNSLIENPSALELGGERRSVTIMMTDLRGFTALSERLQPERVVQMLNAYFEVMVEVALKYDGTINEIIGDALLVIFGAPQEMPDRAQRAIACAIEMQNAMAQVNEQNRSQGLPELEMGIALNETEVIVGNIGSTKRSKYAVVGSGVNMTSRIESYTVGGQILISESVRQEAGEVLRIEAQRDVLPKGSETPLRIYEVGGIAGHYNLALEGKDTALVTLARQIPLRYTVLEGKDVGKKGLKASLVQLSKGCAEITLSGPIEVLTNLKMNLGDVDEKLAAKDFYGKVTGRSGEKGFTHMVRFTSVPPEVDAYFQALLQYAARPSPRKSS